MLQSLLEALSASPPGLGWPPHHSTTGIMTKTPTLGRSCDFSYSKLSVAVLISQNASSVPYDGSISFPECCRCLQPYLTISAFPLSWALCFSARLPSVLGRSQAFSSLRNPLFFLPQSVHRTPPLSYGSQHRCYLLREVFFPNTILQVGTHCYSLSIPYFLLGFCYDL